VATQEATVQANAGSDYGQTDGTYDEFSYSFDSWDYMSIIDSLSGYDWYSEFPNVHVYIGGIAP
jgi:hypothetical protein